MFDVILPRFGITTTYIDGSDIANFEAALKELESIVSRLEQGEVELEESITLYERGQALKSHCETKLKSAEGRLEKIVLGAGGPEIGPQEPMERA